MDKSIGFYFEFPYVCNWNNYTSLCEEAKEELDFNMQFSKFKNMHPISLQQTSKSTKIFFLHNVKHGFGNYFF